MIKCKLCKEKMSRKERVCTNCGHERRPLRSYFTETLYKHLDWLLLTKHLFSYIIYLPIAWYIIDGLWFYGVFGSDTFMVALPKALKYALWDTLPHTLTRFLVLFIPTFIHRLIKNRHTAVYHRKDRHKKMAEAIKQAYDVIYKQQIGTYDKNVDKCDWDYPQNWNSNLFFSSKEEREKVNETFIKMYGFAPRDLLIEQCSITPHYYENYGISVDWGCCLNPAFHPHKYMKYHVAGGGPNDFNYPLYINKFTRKETFSFITLTTQNSGYVRIYPDGTEVDAFIAYTSPRKADAMVKRIQRQQQSEDNDNGWEEPTQETTKYYDDDYNDSYNDDYYYEEDNNNYDDDEEDIFEARQREWEEEEAQRQEEDDRYWDDYRREEDDRYWQQQEEEDRDYYYQREQEERDRYYNDDNYY